MRPTPSQRRRGAVLLLASSLTAGSLAWAWPLPGDDRAAAVPAAPGILSASANGGGTPATTTTTPDGKGGGATSATPIGTAAPATTASSATVLPTPVDTIGHPLTDADYVVDDGTDGGEPRIVVRNGVPGYSGAMTVRIRAAAGTGTRTAYLRLASLAESAGTGGGRLSSRLRVRLLTDTGRLLWSGTPASLDRVALGRLAPSRSATFRFELAFPDGGTPPGPTTGDNAFQGASLDAVYGVEAGT